MFNIVQEALAKVKIFVADSHARAAMISAMSVKKLLSSTPFCPSVCIKVSNPFLMIPPVARINVFLFENLMMHIVYTFFSH